MTSMTVRPGRGHCEAVSDEYHIPMSADCGESQKGEKEAYCLKGGRFMTEKTTYMVKGGRKKGGRPGEAWNAPNVVDRRPSYTGSTTRWEKMWYKVVVGIDTCCSIRSKIEGVKRTPLGRGYNGKGVGGKAKGSKPGSEVLLHSSRDGE
jgi:hypothetical protein